MTKILELQVSELSAVASLQGDTLTVALVGTADATTDGPFGAMIERVHETCRRAPVRAAVIDLQRLEFMNSSCIKRIITWVIAVGQIPGDRRYRIVLRSNPAVSWQRRSLNAIVQFGREHVTIEERGPETSG